MAVDTSSGVPSRPEIDGGEATKAEPSMRRTMAADTSSGAASRPETDCGEAAKAEPGIYTRIRKYCFFNTLLSVSLYILDFGHVTAA